MFIARWRGHSLSHYRKKGQYEVLDVILAESIFLDALAS
jgi:hypothetical protein